MEPYKNRDFIKPSFFKKNPKENFIIEINNLLSSTENILKITVDDIIQLSDKYKVKVKKQLKSERIDLLSHFIKFCLSDKQLENKEIEELRHLKDILLLSEKELNDQIDLLTHEIYKQEVNKAVSDGMLDKSEKANLELLKKNLLIPEEIAKSIYIENASKTLQNFLDEAVSDERLSPEEETQINAMSKSLGIEIKMNDNSKQMLNKFKLYWQIENSDIPEIESKINIQKSEKMHFKADIKWLEQRRVTKRINYGGPTVRIKIAKGVYWRAGSIAPQRISEDEWKVIDTGTLYLTNKRLIFMGGKGNKNLRLNKILDFKPFKNGVDIQKDSGKSPFFEFTSNIDIFSMMLARLMDEA